MQPLNPERRSTDVEARLLALEVSNRRLIAAVLGLGVILFAIFTLTLTARTAGADCDKPAALQVSSLDVVNEAGETVVHLGVRDNGAGGLWVADTDGHRVLKLNQTTEGNGRIAILDEAGREVGVLAVGADGRVRLLPASAG